MLRTKSITVAEWLAEAKKTLKVATSTPALDAEVLLSYVVERDKSWLYTHPEYLLKSDKQAVLMKLLNRRVNFEPVAYITNSVEFFGRKFYVDNRVLVPRPESEAIIELGLKHIDINTSTIIDIGTGSGVLGITLALELTSPMRMRFIDIDADALNVARKNAKNYAVKGAFFQQSLLERHPIDGASAIIANLPYVPIYHPINTPARHEPAHAIFGGEDGLEFYRELFDQLHTHRHTSELLVITESLPFQHQELLSIARSAGFDEIDSIGLSQVFRSTPWEKPQASLQE